MRLNRVSSLLILTAAIAGQPASGFQPKLSPTQTTIEFYRALREKRYVDGFMLSVYGGAVQGLSPEDLKDLEPEFARVFSAIPEKIEAVSEKRDGDSATVTVKFGGAPKPETVALVRVNGRWLVGDHDGLQAVAAQGNQFFFNLRMSAAEQEAADTLTRVIGAELLYKEHRDGVYASLDELIRLEALPQHGQITCYRLAVTLAPDRKSYFATAVPEIYGKTGRLSFYADDNGLRAEDLKGKAASAASPQYKAQ